MPWEVGAVQVLWPDEMESGVVPDAVEINIFANRTAWQKWWKFDVI